MANTLIGIDDTDNDQSPGTGRLARRLGEELARRGARPLGITRHQFLVDPRIPYTSHNSGACVAVQWEGALEEMNVATDLIAQWAAEGSDPGVCIAQLQTVSKSVMDWGWRATREVLTMEEARSLAGCHDLRLCELGGSGQGIIGAMASVGLRAEGNEGRFLDLPGLRELGERVDGRQLARMGIALQHRTAGGIETPPPDVQTVYNTSGWVRPRLVQGKPVWVVQWSDENHEWTSVDRKKKHAVE